MPFCGILNEANAHRTGEPLPAPDAAFILGELLPAAGQRRMLLVDIGFLSVISSRLSPQETTARAAAMAAVALISFMRLKPSMCLAARVSTAVMIMFLIFLPSLRLSEARRRSFPVPSILLR